MALLYLQYSDVLTMLFLTSRERYDTLLEKDMGSGPDLNLDAICHHHSRDSAIDTDLHDLDTETLELDLVIIFTKLIYCGGYC
jgi:hypothetical protein